MIGTITKWRVDWQRSLKLERSIVEHPYSQMITGYRSIQDHRHFAIKNSQIGSQSMKDRLKKSMIMRLFTRLTVLPSMLLLRINEGDS